MDRRTNLLKKRLTKSQRDQLRTAWNDSGGKIDRVARQLGVSWETARRWLIQAELIGNASQRLDRPGLVWPMFNVLCQNYFVIVEAPNWAIACKAVEQKYRVSPLEVCKASKKYESYIGRESIKAMLPGYMDHTLSVTELMQHYVDAGVIVK